MAMGENWLPLIGFEGQYEISDQGRIRGLERLGITGKRINAKILTNARKVRAKGKANSYMRIKLTKEGQLLDLAVHLLVLQTFVGPRPDGMDGCHNDGDSCNNTLTNLRWDTPKGNMADKVLHGTLSTGEKNGFSKLTEADVLRIRSSNAPVRELATEYGVDRSCVYGIRSGKSWKHLQGGIEHASK